ncbi:DUF308 domain-containing protein [Caballeronia sp. LZ033]|uniref:HdeD family acid-resistance protein n=1 Tax=Caballeronia sp. LZ033 TaxID=3038566 RepID=UPI002862BAED|nr:DUF308 domain-containing protein [Caballeronia sp. LZ033]MDR5818676.1 DUF308 domain-containing protein [Caballeronia sp. LZ033]
MFRLVLLVLGVNLIRKRWLVFLVLGVIWILVGIGLFIDALDNALSFPFAPLAWFLLVDGFIAMAAASVGVGGQRILRFVRGAAVLLAAVLIFAGHHHGHFILAMIFGTFFLADGVLQCTSAWVVRHRRWRAAFAWGTLEVLFAISVYQPYPTHYYGTVPWCLAALFVFIGGNTLLVGARVRNMVRNPAFATSNKSMLRPAAVPTTVMPVFSQTEWDGPPLDGETALTVHVWTPTGSSKGKPQNYPLIDRYIAAVDENGVISTGHAALETPEGVYVSLYPAAEIDRSPDEFSRLLRATPDNNVPGVFQPSYPYESKTWCPSTTQVRIRNYDPASLQAFWDHYRQNTTYNLTHRNCSSSVAYALEAALNGAVGRLYGNRAGWGAFVRLFFTPELWVAAQIRKRALTMAWTPGLVLDYARALSMLADPRPFWWRKILRRAWRMHSHAENSGSDSKRSDGGL